MGWSVEWDDWQNVVQSNVTSNDLFHSYNRNPIRPIGIWPICIRPFAPFGLSTSHPANRHSDYRSYTCRHSANRPIRQITILPIVPANRHLVNWYLAKRTIRLVGILPIAPFGESSFHQSSLSADCRSVNRHPANRTIWQMFIRPNGVQLKKIFIISKQFCLTS